MNSREATIPSVLVSSSVAHEQQPKSGDDSQDSPLPITTIEFESSAQEPNVSAVRRRSRLSIGSFTSGVTWQFRKSMELNKEETIELINTMEERTPSSTESSKFCWQYMEDHQAMADTLYSRTVIRIYCWQCVSMG